MNHMYVESQHKLERASNLQGKRTRALPLWARITIIATIWLSVAAGVYMLARYYVSDIQGQLSTIAETNTTQITQLKQQMTTLQQALDVHKTNAESLQAQFSVVQTELTAVKEEMSLAGNSLSSTAETKQALNDRINDLSKELDTLRGLIKKLEEAARVY